eukprot:TRINITY_DN4462_c0_g1_i4.p1 TRINITY_DN4462_c0_g1~~TRINITY_DN4462_c0_g1_i4.p1  ORF type:complete len:181 (+),score=19.00 TRINITY_DN4462_c0_g1_i4:527-1069(+)
MDRRPSNSLADSAVQSPSRRTCLGSVYEKSLGLGPCATPPPTLCGARALPTLAFPVPFWRYSFAVDPRTWPRLLELAEPCLLQARCHTTTLCTRSLRIGSPKTSGLRSRVDTCSPSSVLTGTCNEAVCGENALAGACLVFTVRTGTPVSYTHLRAHETPEHLVCRLLLEKKKKKTHIIQH